ncbi:hypothetical protein J6590_088855 [Homalodisca vitripennis]|nr:hypothetical protein J6590_088855 [Homalodisca vitripennis]
MGCLSLRRKQTSGNKRDDEKNGILSVYRELWKPRPRMMWDGNVDMSHSARVDVGSSGTGASLQFSHCGHASRPGPWGGFDKRLIQI